MQIQVYGPVGLASRFRRLVAPNHEFIEIGPHYSREHATSPYRITPNENGVYKMFVLFYPRFEDADYRVYAKEIRHTIFTLGYVIEEKPPLKFDMEKLTNLGIPPGIHLKDLKMGKTIVYNQKTIRPSDVILNAAPARKMVILGDTFDASNIADLAMDCDVLVHEATNRNENLAEALRTGHSTGKMAGQFAQKIRAKNLIITHFSPRSFMDEHENEVKIIYQQAKQEYTCGRLHEAKVE